MSVRFGMSQVVGMHAPSELTVCCIMFDEVVEQRGHVVRARAGLGMTLEAEGGPVGALDALQGAVEQGPVGCRADCPAALASSTAKPWFWLVIITAPLSRSCTGWLAP